MKCQDIKNIIALDYLDGGLDPVKEDKIKRHVLTCPECMEYKKAMDNLAVKPIEDSLRVSPPEVVWDNITEKIEKDPFLVRRSLKRFLPKPSFVFAFLVMILFSLLLMKNTNKRENDPANLFIAEQAQSLSTMASEGVSGISEGYRGFGTVIEEYFL